MTTELVVYLVAVLGGFMAGIINTLAGSGSIITLGILIELVGLPGNAANATNRVGILVQTLASSKAFASEGMIKWKANRVIIASVVLGAILGSVVAISVSNDQFMFIYKALMVALFFVILIRPKRWLIESDMEYQMPIVLQFVLFFAIGIYAGFIQMGMGVIFLSCMVLLAKKSLLESNVVKLLVTLLLTIPVLALFAYQGLVDWRIGAIIAIGQGLGGYLTAKYIAHSPKANEIAYYTLVGVVLVVLAKMFVF